MDLTDSEYGAATNVADAISEGINCLYALRQCIKAGKLPAPEAEYNHSNVDTTIGALEWAMTELLRNKQLQGGPSLQEEDLLHVRHLRLRINEWLSDGSIPSDLDEFARKCMLALVGEKGMPRL